MPLLPPLTREQISPELHALWDACADQAPAFRHLWSTMAHSPTIFRYIWGELLELKQSSPVAARYFELAVVTVSTLTACNYCVSHHTPLAGQLGYSNEQLDYLLGLRLETLPENGAFPPRPLFDTVEGLVIDLAYFLVWSGIYAPQHETPPPRVYEAKQRLVARLRDAFSPRQLEELVWRVTQCVAFNWHNDFLELDVEAGVPSLLNQTP